MIAPSSGSSHTPGPPPPEMAPGLTHIFSKGFMEI